MLKISEMRYIDNTLWDYSLILIKVIESELGLPGLNVLG